LRFDDHRVLVGDVLDDVGIEHARLQLLALAGAEAGEDGAAGRLQLGRIVAVQLEDAELALDEEDAGLEVRVRLQREVDDALDHQAGRTSMMRACWPANGG
jgi:hypothetical protein